MSRFSYRFTEVHRDDEQNKAETEDSDKDDNHPGMHRSSEFLFKHLPEASTGWYHHFLYESSILCAAQR